MQVPRESLEDFIVDHRPETAEPPPARSVHLTGKVEVLKPLARPNGRTRAKAVADHKFLGPVPFPASNRLSWYHRSLAFSGAVAVGALLLGIIAGIYAPPEPSVTRNEAAQDQEAGYPMAYQNDAATADASPAVGAFYGSDMIDTGRAIEKRRPVRIRPNRTAYRSRRAVPVSHLIVSEFVPTTLVIYIENGEVKTRIEPQSVAAHKKKI